VPALPQRSYADGRGAVAASMMMRAPEPPPVSDNQRRATLRAALGFLALEPRRASLGTLRR
jgi:hypothetical protein